ncbi:MAG: hypothetical protein C0605_17420 [Hyphomicrobiales bacterium]|nr:MAG: hypothetical protein C0605_17420 [Hyphomicrobiales bacterium]
MSTSKFASLHGGLLARKGQAAPAVPSPQSYVVYTDNPPPPERRPVETERRPVETERRPLETEWYPAEPEQRPVEPPPFRPATRPAPETAAPPAPPVVELVPDRLKRELKAAFPHAGPPPPEPQHDCACDAGSKAEAEAEAEAKPSAPYPARSAGKYQVRLRINAEQRRRLRTAAAQFGVSNQRILADALEAYLDKIGQSKLKSCSCLARRAGLKTT